MKLGIIARCDDTGLGNQTLELTKMLNPDKVLLIDSSTFHFYNRQHPDRYADYNVMHVHGMPTNRDAHNLLKDVDVVLSCETFYNNNFVDIAKKMGKKTVLQYNYEFLDYIFNSNLTPPDVLLSPSTWKFNEVQEKFSGKSKVIYLPPPIDSKLFSENVVHNSSLKRRILHIAGKPAAHDRNGTKTVIEMLKYSVEDYELVIRSQTKLEIIGDDRVKIVDSNEPTHTDLYDGYDAMVLPRRYAGLCLPMNEALMSGLPVFMTDVSPNNDILPKRWLAQSEKIGEFMTRSMIDIHEANPQHLASLIDAYISRDMTDDKEDAYVIGYSNFSAEVLKPRYENLLDSLPIS